MSDTTQPGALDLARTPVHLGAKDAVVQADFNFDGPSFGAYMAAHCSDDEPGRLAMIETTPGDWPAWECHTQGDEVVIVLSGKAEFIQEIDGSQQRIAVGPGAAVVNPRGVWHTADVSESMTALYLTPCPGTESRPR